jgi:alpha-N-arabinofuranosidase
MFINAPEQSMKRALWVFTASILLQFPVRAQVEGSKISIDASLQEYQIDKNIYGQFSEHLGHLIYGGIWVGPDSPIPNVDGIRKDVVGALKHLQVPVLRWPGGCFADEYHWENGIGPRSGRPKMINTNWGGVTEDNSFGTHEFLRLCELIGCEPYITGNVGSGSVEELSRWVEYVNSENVSPMTDLRKKYGREDPWGVKYWGIGNENWGCGGNMLPEFYADQARRFGTFMHRYGANKVVKIACGPSDEDYNWTTVLMKKASRHFDGLSLHHYSFASQKVAADFDEAGWFDIMDKSLKMEVLVTRHSAIMDQYDPFKRVALVVDEWGTWYKVEPGTNPGFLYQQNTMRDAVAAACNLNIFNNHADRVRMANIAQVVNVLQAMILTEGEKMILTPTYHVFDLFKVHQNAMMIPVKAVSRDYTFKGKKLPAVNCSASIDTREKVHISLCNVDPAHTQNVFLDLKNFEPATISGKELSSDKMNAHNTFERPDAVKPADFSGFTQTGSNISVAMPPMSVVVLELTGKVKAQPPIEVKNPKPGLDYAYYEIGAETMPPFESLTPKTTGAVESVVLPEEARESDFGVKYDGYLKVPEDGLYTLYANSDDGSAILIDGRLIVNNDGRHSLIERSGIVQLTAGYHRFELMFFQAGGGLGLIASIKGPHLEKQVIPVSMLFRK